MNEAYYEPINASTVDPKKVRVAEEVLVRACIYLGLPPVKIAWVRRISELDYKVLFRLAEIQRITDSLLATIAERPDRSFNNCQVIKDQGGFGGLAQPFGQNLGRGGWKEPFITICADVSFDRVGYIVVHELKHLADWRDQRFNFFSAAGIEAAEKSADEFARSFMQLARRETQVER